VSESSAQAEEGFAQVGGRFALVGGELALVGEELALVGERRAQPGRRDFFLGLARNQRQPHGRAPRGMLPVDADVAPQLPQQILTDSWVLSRIQEWCPKISNLLVRHLRDRQIH
jgi:hypothetical protein